MYQKDPKSAKKWLSYGHFLTERLCDSIEKHMGQNGILWCLFVPKISKIGQEIAELGAFPPERLRESIEKHIIASYIIASCIIVSCIIASNIFASLHQTSLHHCKSFFQGVKGCVTHELQSSEVEASKNRIDQKI